MITTLLFDFSRVLLFSKDAEYKGMLNSLHSENSKKPDYRFFDYFELNEELLDYLEKIKDRFSFYIFTTGTIQNVAEVRERTDPIFKRVFAAAEVKVSKKESEAYLKIAKEMGKNPNEILFIDDTKENVKAAKEAGLKTIHYHSNKQIFTKLGGLCVKVVTSTIG